ncbi:uncharacterized protein [Musca autumnalis]|uniref:uncharacterized protein n=1 Tax=Musca autumnalis TaxID=221902 RepID=UPI003CE7D395
MEALITPTAISRPMFFSEVVLKNRRGKKRRGSIGDDSTDVTFQSIIAKLEREIKSLKRDKQAVSDRQDEVSNQLRTVHGRELSYNRIIERYEKKAKTGVLTATSPVMAAEEIKKVDPACGEPSKKNLKTPLVPPINVQSAKPSPDSKPPHRREKKDAATSPNPAGNSNAKEDSVDSVTTKSAKKKPKRKIRITVVNEPVNSAKQRDTTECTSSPVKGASSKTSMFSY